jgi:hypothetical protein
LAVFTAVKALVLTDVKPGAGCIVESGREVLLRWLLDSGVSSGRFASEVNAAGPTVGGGLAWGLLVVAVTGGVFSETGLSVVYGWSDLRGLFLARGRVLL